MQEPKTFRERRTAEETRVTDLEWAEVNDIEDNEDFVQLVECFQRNSAGSACPNTAKGKFVSFQEARDIFRPLKN